MKLSELAKLVGGEIVSGQDTDIERVAKIEEAGPGDITFLANPKYKKHLATTRASAVLVERGVQFKELLDRKSPPSCVAVEDPYLAFLQLLDTLFPPPAPLPRGVHPSAIIAQSAAIGSNVGIGAHAVIGERARLGNNVSIHPGCVLGDDTQVGDDSLLYASVCIRESCVLGNRVIVHPGTVIGSDGFGFAPMQDDTYRKIPQRGRVVIEDDVEIGANCAIDRATIGETRIGKGAKLDNLIQVAHNVVIGENTVIAAQSGISGSTKIGNHCMIAGQVGFVGHITIADRTTIGAQSGISKSITEPGQMYFGYPASEHRTALRVEAATRELPDLLVEVRDLRRRIAELEAIIQETERNRRR